MDFAFGASAEKQTESEEKREVYFFPISISKLTLLWIGTIGLYSVYWFYKNWKYIKTRDSRPDILPFWRGVFSVFFTHSLFKEIDAEAEDKGMQRAWDPTTTASIFVILAIIGNVLSRVSSKTEEFYYLDFIAFGFLFLALLPIYSVQKTINEINVDPKGRINNKFHPAEYFILILGFIFWALVLIGIFLPAEN